ncbi:MAG: MFS transporter [Methanoregula sp.]|uniref:MFS transporter n=1 Tax=Methanoregula sp. TaxID=2052170 RepID=UPI003C3AF19F
MIILGAPVFAFGIIESLSDGASSFVKLFSGYFADKLGRRREFALGGSVATAVFPAIIAIASSWYVVLAGRLAGWIGKGIRSPTRDAILSKSVETKDLGKAIGRVHSGNHFGG